MTYQEIVNRIKKLKSNLGISNKRKLTPEIEKIIKQERVEYSTHGQDDILEVSFCDFVLKNHSLSTNQFLNSIKAEIERKKRSMSFIQKVIKQAPINKLSGIDETIALNYFYSQYLKRCKELTENLKDKALITILFKSVYYAVNRDIEITEYIKSLDSSKIIQKYKLYLNKYETNAEKSIAQFNLLSFPYSININAECIGDEEEMESNPWDVEYDISLQVFKFDFKIGYDIIVKELHLGTIDGSQVNGYTVSFNQVSYVLDSNSALRRYINILPDSLPITSFN